MISLQEIAVLEQAGSIRFHRTRDFRVDSCRPIEKRPDEGRIEAQKKRIQGHLNDSKS